MSFRGEGIVAALKPLRSRLLVAAASGCWVAGAAHAISISDPLGSMDAVSPTPAGRMVLTEQAPCSELAALASPLNLIEVVEHALCHNPKTGRAWASVQAQAAAVGTGRAAYLPTLNVGASVARVSESTKFAGAASQFNSKFYTNSNDENINLNWVLFDFGLRSANLDYAKALLNAASAAQDDAVQAVFIDAAQAFYSAEAAQAALGAAMEAEQAAEQSFNTADGKARAGAGAVADRLQAKTAYAQATLKRIQTHGDLQDAYGTLAVTMGLPPDTELALPGPVDSTSDEPLVKEAVTQLIAVAERDHPKVLAAKAQLEAAREKVSATRAAGRPSIALTGLEDRSDTPINKVSSKQRILSRSIGLQLTIPLFEGFARTYKVRQARAEAESKEVNLFDTEQQVSLEVWKSYQAVLSQAEDLEATAVLLESAAQSFNIAQGRYKSGVGTILELLRAQTDLATAKEQRLVTITRWQVARLQLGASLGQLQAASLAPQ